MAIDVAFQHSHGDFLGVAEPVGPLLLIRALAVGTQGNIGGFGWAWGWPSGKLLLENGPVEIVDLQLYIVKMMIFHSYVK